MIRVARGQEVARGLNCCHVAQGIAQSAKLCTRNRHGQQLAARRTAVLFERQPAEGPVCVGLEAHHNPR